MTNEIQVERRGSLATVTFNRPEKHNAFTIGMYAEFGDTMRSLSEDDAVRCILVRGAGDRAFCAGSDIGEFGGGRMGAAQAREYAEKTSGPFRHLYGCRHPTVAAIRGICVGGGLELAIMCDIRICSPDSRFGIPPNRLGLTLDFAELSVLCEVVGRSKALEILLEGRIFGADEALQLGLVSRVVEPAKFDEEVGRTVDRILASAPLSNRWHKAFVRRLADPAPLSEEELGEAYLCYDTQDYLEGTAAFNEKRSPVFVGR